MKVKDLFILKRKRNNHFKKMDFFPKGWWGTRGHRETKNRNKEKRKGLDSEGRRKGVWASDSKMSLKAGIRGTCCIQWPEVLGSLCSAKDWDQESVRDIMRAQ